ncbi:MAG TPA: DUF559 domain-containing protein [Solirubrobacteraceae bacterium]|nr:DUF559 domain-containing protein [Solirubrobacteraceae bacterium]
MVARAQLLAAGWSADAIGRRLRSRRLRALHRGVYAVGHLALRREAHWLAATLACGQGAVLSGAAVDQAEVLRLFDLGAVHATITAHRGRPGAPRLAAVLEQHDAGSTVTRSELEERFLRFCDERGIPRPRVNEMIAGLEVDFSWPRLRLAVELDGWAFHRTRAAFERDRRRDTVLAAAGVRVLRFTHHQLTTTPAEVAGALQAPRSISSIR